MSLIQWFANKLYPEIKAIQSMTAVRAFESASMQIYPAWSVFKEIETYRIQDDIYSVCKFLADNAAMIPIYAYDKDGGDLPETNPITKLLTSLNFEQRFKLFLYLNVTDECFIYKEVLEFGPNAGVQSIHFLHPNLMTLSLSQNFPTTLNGYIYRDQASGQELRFSPDEIIFIKGFNPSSDYQKQWRGLSKISVLARPLQRIKSGSDVSVAQIQNGGVPGVLYEKSNDFDSVALGKRQTDFAAYVSNPENKGAPYVSLGDMGYFSFGSTLVELDLSALAAIDRKSIYNAYSVSGRLFNQDGTGSEISDDNARKGLFNNAIRPQLIQVQDALTNGLIYHFKQPGVTLRFDMSEIKELQDDILKQIQAAAAAPSFIPNEIRDLQGYDRIDDPIMNQVWMKSGYTPIDTFNDIPPIV